MTELPAGKFTCELKRVPNCHMSAQLPRALSIRRDAKYMMV